MILTVMDEPPVCTHGVLTTQVCAECETVLNDLLVPGAAEREMARAEGAHDQMGRPHNPTASWPCWCVTPDPAWQVPD
jgi:hypothetical protein